MGTACEPVSSSENRFRTGCQCTDNTPWGHQWIEYSEHRGNNNMACISTSLVTLFTLGPDTLEFLLSSTAKGQAMVGPYPYPVLWSSFLLLCMVVHTAEILVTRTLVQAWAPRH